MSKVSKITREEWRKDSLRARSDFTEEELLSHISILLDEVEDLEELNKTEAKCERLHEPSSSSITGQLRQHE